MHFRAVLAAGALMLGSFAAAQDGYDNGYPGFLSKHYPHQPCANLCGPLVTASVACATSDNKQQCICDYNDSYKRQIPNCEACAKQTAQNDGYEAFISQISTLRQTCGFKESDKEYSGASGLTSPAIGAGVVAAAAAFAAL